MDLYASIRNQTLKSLLVGADAQRYIQSGQKGCFTNWHFDFGGLNALFFLKEVRIVSVCLCLPIMLA
jgi:hypothetical protein